MMKMSKGQINRIQIQSDEAREISQISIESNVGAHSRGKFTEDPSTQFESAIPAQDYAKKAKVFTEEPLSEKLGKDRIVKRVASKERDRSKNKKRVSPNIVKQMDQTQKVSMDNKYEFLLERVKDLEKNSLQMELSFSNTVDKLKSELKVREEKSAGVRADVDLIKKDLAERKRDIIELIGMIKNTGLGQPAEQILRPLIKHHTQLIQQAPTSSQRQSKPEKIKKTSNEKGKKVNSPGKKAGIQLKQRSPSGKAAGKL